MTPPPGRPDPEARTTSVTPAPRFPRRPANSAPTSDSRYADPRSGCPFPQRIPGARRGTPFSGLTNSDHVHRMTRHPVARIRKRGRRPLLPHRVFRAGPRFPRRFQTAPTRILVAAVRFRSGFPAHAAERRRMEESREPLQAGEPRPGPPDDPPPGRPEPEAGTTSRTPAPRFPRLLAISAPTSDSRYADPRSGCPFPQRIPGARQGAPLSRAGELRPRPFLTRSRGNGPDRGKVAPDGIKPG
ncbi:hypothetical protein J2X01_002417 [Arthrobacter ginsengisoli]|uniref:Uncharacterized protein n=1 Tax=Arthrobacter ginsengisoli TaxID=1356565 RepID=A0ABU1UD49_9MICC|nr:hypothetical protein [Arthrobacter ginsengisoli]